MTIEFQAKIKIAEKILQMQEKTKDVSESFLSQDHCKVPAIGTKTGIKTCHAGKDRCG